MKKLMLSLLAMLFILSAHSQSNIRIHSVTVNLGYKNTSSWGGTVKGIELAADWQKNLIVLEFSHDGHMVFPVWATEFNLLYGRDFQLGKRFSIEPNAGVGIFTKREMKDHRLVEDQSVAGFPVKLKFVYHTDRRIDLGLAPIANFNSVSTNYGGALVLRYRFHD